MNGRQPQLVTLKMIAPRAGFCARTLLKLAFRETNPFPLLWDDTIEEYVANEADIDAWNAKRLETQVPVQQAKKKGLIRPRKAS